MAQNDPPAERDYEVIRAEMLESGLPLPDPFPEYVTCPHCGEPEVEVWCYQRGVHCHACGEWLEHETPPCYGCDERCRALAVMHDE